VSGRAAVHGGRQTLMTKDMVFIKDLEITSSSGTAGAAGSSEHTNKGSTRKAPENPELPKDGDGNDCKAPKRYTKEVYPGCL
jgi:hypothetical protein